VEVTHRRRKLPVQGSLRKQLNRSLLLAVDILNKKLLQASLLSQPSLQALRGTHHNKHPNKDTARGSTIKDLQVMLQQEGDITRDRQVVEDMHKIKHHAEDMVNRRLVQVTIKIRQRVMVKHRRHMLVMARTKELARVMGKLQQLAELTTKARQQPQQHHTAKLRTRQLMQRMVKPSLLALMETQDLLKLKLLRAGMVVVDTEVEDMVKGNRRQLRQLLGTDRLRKQVTPKVRR